MSEQLIDISTGLSSVELSEVFQNNPRAYMAVRGAVAEKHLEKKLIDLVKDGSISHYQSASGDMDKDFYIKVDGRVLSVECKNVEVEKINTKSDIIAYLYYLGKNKYISIRSLMEQCNIEGEKLGGLKLIELKTILRLIPQKFRESGLTRYEYSASKIPDSNLDNYNSYDFIFQFEKKPLTIDFKRTRNSTDVSGDTRKNRFYREEEIDIVAACLFSRTMSWQFVFAKASDFEMHPRFTGRYSDKLSLRPGVWVSNLSELISGC